MRKCKSEERGQRVERLSNLKRFEVIIMKSGGITFLPRSKRHLISWLHSPSVVILEPGKIKSDTVSTVSPMYTYG